MVMVALGSAVLAVWSTGCLPNIDDVSPTPPTPTPPTPTPPTPTPGPAPVPPTVQGLVTSPTNGQLIAGTTTDATINVQGTYTGTSTNLSVQIMDPTNNNQWTTVGAAPVQSQAFSVVVGPFNEAQFPQGGLLSLRVIDGTGGALPYQLNNDATYSNSALVVGSPGQNPEDWTFLTQAPLGSQQTTAEYYNVIGAPKTLTDFETEFFPQGTAAGGAAQAFYYNKGDLAVGRALACNTTQTGGVACFVEALGSFDGDENVALTDVKDVAEGKNVTPVATVAMIYNPPITNPNAIQFIVYNGQGALQDFAQLDAVGNNTAVPQNCLNCHGGQSTFNAETFQVTGAQWLQLDPLAMDFVQSPGLTFADQQNAVFQMEQLTQEASPTTTERELISGEWTNEGGTALFNADFVPGAWNTTQRDANLYQQAIAPFCRGCHASIAADTAGLTFQSPADFVANSTKIINEVCGGGPTGMPVAQATGTRFFNGITPGCNEAGCTPNNISNLQMSARALIVEYLGAGSASGGCSQGQIP